MPGAARACPRSPAAADFLATAAARPVVVADLVAPALSADGVRACAAEIAGFAGACLTGDHPGARVQFPPSYQARLLAAEGVTAWAGISCRDRNRVALEGEIAACADAGVAVASFAADRLPPGYLDAIMSAPDPAESGVTAAVHFAEAALAVPGVNGVNLSAGAGPGQELDATRAMAEVSRRVLGAPASRRPGSAGRVS
jgi:hypothetical protein